MQTKERNSSVPTTDAAETPNEKFKRLNADFKAHMLSAYAVEAEMWELFEMKPAKVDKPTRKTTGYATPEFIKEVQELMQEKPKGVNPTEFTVILGRCGVAGVKQVMDARAELEAKEVIKVTELGTGRGRGSAKLITLVEKAD